MDTLPSLPASQRTPKSDLPGAIAASRSPSSNALWRALRKRWIPAIAVAGTVFAGVAFSTLLQTPRYQSETLILLDNETSVPVVPVSPTDGAAYYKDPRDLATEVQILRSGPLIARALRQLEGPYKNLSIAEVADNLVIRQAGEADVLIVAYTDTNPQRVKAVLEALGSTYVNYSLEKKRSQASNAIQFIEAQLPEARQALNKSASDIKAFRKHYGIVDPDPYATAVSEAKQTLQAQSKEVEIALNQTKTQEQKLRRQMVDAGLDPQSALPNTVLGQDGGYQRLVNQLQEIESDLARESIRLQENHPVIANLKTRRNKTLSLLQRQARRVLGKAVSQADLARPGTSATARSGGSAISQPAVTTSAAGEGQGASTSATNTSIADAGAIQQSLVNQLLQVQAGLAVRTTQLTSIRQAQAEVDNRFQKIPDLQQRYTELQRQFSLNSKAVDHFLEKLQELRINEAQETSPWKVLEPPYIPGTPISPNISRSLLLGLISGGVLGVLLAVLLERLDRRVKAVEEAKLLTGIPLLGAIPRSDIKVLTLSGDESRLQRFNPFVQALRSLALNLPYLGSSGSVKVLAFTSAIPAEGKSTITYNLGLVLAELGYRVLVVDADMYKPSLHKLSQRSNASGLSTAIATERPWHELTHSSESEQMNMAFSRTRAISPAVAANGTHAALEPHHPGQHYSTTLQPPDVMTSGPLPPNPISLLGSEKMTHLLEEWRQVYDYVLIDTPPIVGIADAQSIASKVDGVVLVTAVEHSTSSSISRAMEILEASQCNIAGLVVNLLNADHEGYYSYQYYTSYYGDAASSDSSNGSSRPSTRHRSHRQWGWRNLFRYR